MKIRLMTGRSEGAWTFMAFFDDGRVWVKDNSSHVLHTGYGGGI